MKQTLVAACAVLVGVGSATAQQTGAFVVRLGVDTLAVEQYTRTLSQLRGEQVIRAPRTAHRIYTVRYGPNGVATHFELVTHNIGGDDGPVETRSTAEFTPTTVTMPRQRGDSSTTATVAISGPAAPFAINVYALIEDVIRQARATGGDRFEMPIFSLGDSEAENATVRTTGPDSLVATFGAIGPFRIWTDAQGTLRGLSGIGGALQVTVERVPALDIAAFGPAFASRPLGTLSPPDSVMARIGAADLAIRYSRPSARGRKIFGAVVPWDRVWRTGANAATTFETSADLLVGGITVPAGRYSLYTVPSQSGWMLIFNSKTPPSGSQYDVQYDVARIAMHTTTLPEMVEQFTMAIEPSGSGGTLSLAWEQTRAWVSFAVK